MSYSIQEIEGIGPIYAARLDQLGIKTTVDYLDRARDPKGRRALEEETGIDAKRILKWANMADLMRIGGIGEEYSDLLEAAGVDTVKELKHRNAANLTAKMVEVNQEKSLVRQVPNETQVSGWIAQAEGLDPVLTY